MTKTQDIEGEMVEPLDHEAAWRALAPVMDDELIGWFMWMYDVQLVTGERLHALKHQATRRYLHVDAELNAWAYVDGDPARYRRVSLVDVLEEVFATWGRLCHEPEDIAMGRAAIERAERREAAQDVR